MADDPYKYFRLEARELLDQFASGVLELEKKGGGAARVQHLLRLAHTLKGAARIVKQREIADRAHAIEDTLSPLRDSVDAIDRERIDAVLDHLDEIGDHVRLLAPPESAVVAGQVKLAADDGVRTVRAEIAEMDAVLDGVSAAHALLGGFRGAAQATEQARHLADLLLAQFAPQGASDSSRQSFADRERFVSIAEELRRKVGGLERALGAPIEQMDRELRQLRDAAEQLRLASAGMLFTTLARAARDTAQAQSKHVLFEGTGGDIRLDAHVLGIMQGALVQLVRNAVAHGIEAVNDRRKAGKPETGRVSVDVSRRGRRIVFQCRDDGGGLDVDAVRRVAVKRGLADAKAKGDGAEAFVRLLLHGGISTSEVVTEVSGRGIGLDVVREAVERLGGEVAVTTNPGSGTVFELAVPLSLASMEVLIVEASGIVAGIPLDAVNSSTRVAVAEISRASSGASIAFGAEAIPFFPLVNALGGREAARARHWTVVIVTGAGGLAAIGIDRLLGTARVVVRPMPLHASAGAIVAGASLDAEGNPQLVLDPDGLVSMARRRDVAEPDPVALAHPVLVVDDSLTTRMLEQSILESAGYAVEVALSAEEALEVARRKRYALFLVDVEMPGMDGFTFVERIRADPALRAIPAILVTSRAAPEDLQRGRDVGAQGYVVKSEFDQSALLAMIRPLVG
jgi:two-component system chemotaxis sensor kinase CheA